MADQGVVNIYVGPAIGSVTAGHATKGHTADVLRSWCVPRWRQGGLKAAVLQIESWSGLAIVLSEIAQSEGELALVSTKAQHDALPDDVFGISFSLEGYGSFAGDFDGLHAMAEIGLTAFTFSHNAQNVLATGVGDRAGEGGFTHLGKATLEVLREMPVMVDLVHLSRASFWDALSIYDGDVFVSHANAASVCGHPRNLTDDQLRAVAERGGVVGLNSYRGYVADDPMTATASDLLDHALHICEVVGPQHLAIGVDYWEAPMETLDATMAGVDPDGSLGLAGAIYAQGPVGLEEITKLGTLVSGLSDRGLTPDEVALVCGGSYLTMLERTRP